MNERTRNFESVVLVHLDSAYNLARWLLRDHHLAEDVVQEAVLRAFRFFDGFNGGDARPWLLGIVRNTSYTWLTAAGRGGEEQLADEESASEHEPLYGSPPATPEAVLQGKQENMRINMAIESLTPAFREVLVLRELEDMSYGDIARIVGIPVGTVMSRLARARTMLRAKL